MPAYESHRETSKAAATPPSDELPPATGVAISGPLPTTNRTTPATGCESAETTR